METLPRLMPYIKGRTADGVTPDDVRVHLSEMLAGSIPAAATNTGEKGIAQGG